MRFSFLAPCARRVASLVPLGIACALGTACTPSFEASPTVDAGVPDADGDAGSNDGSANDGTAGDGSVTYCQAPGATYAFCSDFDGLPFPAPWVPGGTDPGVSLAVDSSMATSPPSSLLIHADAATQAPVRRALLTKDGVKRGNFYTVQLDLFLERIDFPDFNATDSSITLFAVQQGPYVLALTLAPVQGGAFAAALVEIDGTSTPPPPHVLKTTPTIGGWTHLRFDVSLALSGSTVTIGVDERSQKETLTFPAAALTQARSLILGVTAKGTYDELVAHVDDVTYSAK